MNSQKIIISCDTTIALSKKEILEKGYHVIPLNAIADGKEYHDTVDIDNNKLSDLMVEGAKVSTSTPTIGEIEDYFENLFKETNADLVIHFTISSKLSSMYSLFTTVCEEKYKDRVIVVDSLSICYYIEQQVEYATRLANEGYDAKTIIEKVQNDLIGTGEIIFVPDSLTYLRRGGRISPAVATIANLIGVIPVLEFKDGAVGKKGVTRTFSKAIISALKEFQEKYSNLEKDYELIIVATDDKCGEKTEKIIELIKEFAPNMSYRIAKISLNVTAHAGPKTIGVGIAKKI